MVGRGVRDDGGRGAERDERLVAFIHFRDGIRAAPEADGPVPSRHVRAVHAQRVEPACGEDVSEHGRHRRFAARPDDGDELVALQGARERLRPVRDGNAAFVRLAQPCVRLLDCRRDDDLVRRLANAAAVVRKDRHAQRFEKADVGRVPRPVGARHHVTLFQERRRERAHADAANANQMPFHKRCRFRGRRPRRRRRGTPAEGRPGTSGTPAGRSRPRAPE